MHQTVVLAGATDQSVLVRADTISTGTPNTSLTHASSGLEIRYKRGATGAVTTVSPVTQTSTGAHSDGGFVHLHGGVYRVDLPDAAFAAAAPWVVITLAGVTDVRFTVATVDLSDGDPRAAVATAAALTTVDNEIATLDANVDTLLTRVTAAVATASALTTVDNEIATIDANVDTILARVTAAVATATDLATVDANVDTLISRVTAAVATASALTTVDNEIAALQSDVTAIKDKTDDLTFTSAGLVDANLRRINSVGPITGDGGADKFDVV